MILQRNPLKQVIFNKVTLKAPKKINKTYNVMFGNFLI